jgi:hypothetical protein
MTADAGAGSAAGGAGRSGEHEAITASGLVHRGPGPAGRSNEDAAVAFDVETPPPGGDAAANGGAAAKGGKDADALPPPPAPGGSAPGPSGVVEHVSYAEIAKQFSLLGWTAFGGPAAHIGIMQKVSAGLRTRRPPQLRAAGKRPASPQAHWLQSSRLWCNPGQQPGRTMRDRQRAAGDPLPVPRRRAALHPTSLNSLFPPPPTPAPPPAPCGQDALDDYRSLCRALCARAVHARPRVHAGVRAPLARPPARRGAPATVGEGRSPRAPLPRSFGLRALAPGQAVAP